MYNKSKAKSEQILKLFEEGVRLTEICKLTSSSSLTVKKILLTHGINFDSKREEDQKYKLDLAIELYKQGKSQTHIEQELHLTRKTIRTLLKSQDLGYRSKSDQHHIRWGTELDHTCFDQLTPESLYWIGMIFTDGNIGKKESCIELTQHIDDIGHLEKFKKFLGSSRKITVNKEGKPSLYKGRSIPKKAGGCGRIRINSKNIHTKLIDLGVTPAKSLTAKPHDLLKHSKDFWRGCIDGDGGVYNYKLKTMMLCGSLETIFDFIIFCNKEAGVKEKYPSPCKSSGFNLFQVHYYGEDCRKILTLLYKDAPVYLDRKYSQAMEIIQGIPGQESLVESPEI